MLKSFMFSDTGYLCLNLLHFLDCSVYLATTYPLSYNRRDYTMSTLTQVNIIVPITEHNILKLAQIAHVAFLFIIIIAD